MLVLGMNWNKFFICKDEKNVIDKYGLQDINDLECNHKIKQITFTIKSIGIDQDEGDLIYVRIISEFTHSIAELLGHFIADKIDDL